MASRDELATPRRGGQDRRLPQQAKNAGGDIVSRRFLFAMASLLALAATLKVGIGVALPSYAFIGTIGAPWKRLGALIGGTVSILALPS
jgi:hypothetical protein